MPTALIRLGLIDSTQSFLERNLHLAPCGVMADGQTHGRGRHGNAWTSALGAGLWLSAALPVPAVVPGLLLQRAMGAVAEALEPWGVRSGLKWPNDLVAWHCGRLVKLAGIVGAIKGNWMVMGMGLNLGSAPEIPGRAIPPACVADLLPGQPLPEAEALALEILEAWSDLTILREPGFRWPEAGDPIRWEDGEGTCAGWLPDGRLAVDTAAGQRQLSAGDVSGMAAG